MTAPILLSDEQMQRFIAHGYLLLRTELPESFHRAVYDKFDRMIGFDAAGNPGNNLLPAVPELTAVFDDPAVRGALTSVLGPDYVMHPHRALHNNMPGSDAQRMHKDSYWGYLRRVRNHRSRWAMVMYVPQATPLERGPTGVIPGSQYQMQKPDETIMPEVPGSLATGGFLLIHYDIWHRKMKNHTADKRFMMKFEFIRMQAPSAPSWDTRDPAWRLADPPSVDLSAVWRRQWDWLRGATPAERRSNVDPSQAAAQLADADPHTRLRAISRLAENGAAVRAHLAPLAQALNDGFEPVAVNAAYAMAEAGDAALPHLAAALGADGGEDPDGNRSSHDGTQPDPGRPARCAAYALAEVGLPAVPVLLDVLQSGGTHARKLAAFALGEIAGTDEDVAAALCRSTADTAAPVRINAVEALGLKGATPATVAALSNAIKDPDPQVRFSAALSLAQIGPAAELAVPALQDALGDDNRYVPGYAVEALERIATPDAMRALLPYLKSARWCPHTTPSSIY
ncbi:MAG: HEAT repeat domain-containing protein [Acidisphaera sp.]|nr:HEAT repeat domain-containing protein [Acidisphaera sp.]